MNYNFTPFPVLETARLTLRALNLDDAKAIFGLRTNKEVNEFIDRKTPRNLSEARAFIDRISTLAENSKGIFWVLESKSNHQLMGTIGLRNFEDEENYAEIGYEIDPIHQQKGFMSEAFKAVLNFGFKELELKTIEAFTHKDNDASIALLEQQKFTLHPERRDEGFENNRSYRKEA
ncbi:MULTISPECIES: GNAT family N-acetyltransferase [unclassified Polaribacter]|uniref:GNAT family N-acetyltransferase n=1 Tax=unclassified Polaribacter TaxID=196858 RepID=UPI0011BDB73F|nr:MULTISPECIES: GNAT family N-acetyltransferase [unclassified Polaribacter]TXD53021.1 GNAT family N-acetyltransferase [Polaribacter sp. IC063]TXD59478.1 GNAT family N-acetyltransferase [Polaribacter sp. IC066]